MTAVAPATAGPAHARMETLTTSAEAPSPAPAPPRPLMLACLLAVLAGWADFGTHLIRRLRPSSIPTGMGPDGLWMSPLVNLLWLGLPAVVLALAARRWPHRVSAALAFRVLGFVALFDVVLVYQRLHAAAALLLALGLSARLAPMAAEYCRRHPRHLGRVTRGVVAVAVAAPLALAGGGRWLERRAVAALPDARPGAPNVLLLVLDTVRSMEMSLYGYDRPTTPRLARWAAQGVRFDAAFATAPWTLPSHAGMFTGRYPSELTADWKVPLDRTFPTLAEALRSDGYATGSFVANLSYCTSQYGLTRGFIHTDGYPVSLGMLFASSAYGRRLLLEPVFRRAVGFWNYAAYKTAPTVNEEFLSWLAHAGGRPFFAFLNYYDAHQPALPPAPFDTLFGPPPSPRPPEEAFGRRDISDAELTRYVAQYDGAIRYLDQQVDALLTELARRGLLDNTLVIITSDHGEHWGDHQRLSHGTTVYRQVLQVPLVLRFPARFPGGAVVPEPVSLRDIPATVLDVVRSATRDRFPGASLAPYAEAHADAGGGGHPTPVVRTRPVLSGNGPRHAPGQLSLIAEGMHYVRDPQRGEELYDVRLDPLDSRDLAQTPTGRAALPRLRRMVDSLTRR